MLQRTGLALLTLVVVAVTGLPAEAQQASGDWGPDIVPADAVELGYRPCGDRSDIRRCLEEKGLSPAAIDFSFAAGDDLAGELFAIDFHETGPVDVATVEFNGAYPQRWPVLLNGPVGLMSIETTRDLAATFRDPTSRKMLQRFPDAISWSGEIRAHRLLEDGTQRFAHVETVVDGCHACPILGTAISFLEIGPATGEALQRRPIGLSLSDPGDDFELTSAAFGARPASLQTMLNALGYDAGAMDGLPGPQTRSALMAFQADQCLPQTGEPDPATATALLASTGFDAPCTGQTNTAPQPVTVTSVSEILAPGAPLLVGLYVNDPDICQDAAVTPGNFDRILTIGQQSYERMDTRCAVQSAALRDGETLMTSTCDAEGTFSDVLSTWQIKSNQSFVERGDGWQIAWTRCPDDAPLVR